MRHLSLSLLALTLAACGGKDDTTDDSATDDSSVEDSGESCTEASAPSALTLDGEAFPRQAPAATWSAPEAGCADTDYYEVALGLSDTDDVLTWTRVDDVSWDGSVEDLLPADSAITLSVRAVDAVGNISDEISSDSFELWAPAGMGGLVSWYDWADQHQLTASDCSTPVATGERIGCALDKSGNNNTLVVLHDGSKWVDGPKLGELNGQPAADFHGDTVLYVPHNDSVAITGDEVVIAVVDHPTDMSAYGYPLNKEGSYEVAYSTSGFIAAVDTTASGLWAWGGPGVSAPLEPQLNVFIYDGSYWHFRRNGVDLGTIAPQNNQYGNINPGYFNYSGHIITETPLVIGGRPLSYTLSYEATQGELLLLESVPALEDLETMETYLMQKWGL